MPLIIQLIVSTELDANPLVDELLNTILGAEILPLLFVKIPFSIVTPTLLTLKIFTPLIIQLILFATVDANPLVDELLNDKIGVIVPPNNVNPVDEKFATSTLLTSTEITLFTAHENPVVTDDVNDNEGLI
jgi:hypothetical protein